MKTILTLTLHLGHWQGLKGGPDHSGSIVLGAADSCQHRSGNVQEVVGSIVQAELVCKATGGWPAVKAVPWAGACGSGLDAVHPR